MAAPNYRLNKDGEVCEILSFLPNEESKQAKELGPYKHPRPNAVVFFNRRRNIIEIWPDDGGWLAVPVEHLQGDIAPWHG